MDQAGSLDEQLAKLEEQLQQMLPDCPYEMVQEGRTAAAVALLSRLSASERERYRKRIDCLLASAGIDLGPVDELTGTA